MSLLRIIHVILSLQLCFALATASSSCGQTFTIEAGGGGWPDTITVPTSPRAECLIKIVNDDSKEHSISPERGSISEYYFGGQVVYERGISGISQTPHLADFIIDTDWPDGTYPTYDIFDSNNTGAIIVGSGICSSNCLPTDPPTPPPIIPCPEDCSKRIPPAPYCTEGHVIVTPVANTSYCDTIPNPNECVWTNQTTNCAQMTKECDAGQCVPPGGTAPSPSAPSPINFCVNSVTGLLGDPCITPPSPACYNSTFQVTYAQQGTCTFGASTYNCFYSATYLNCAGLGDTCVNKKCTGVNPTNGATSSAAATTTMSVAATDSTAAATLEAVSSTVGDDSTTAAATTAAATAVVGVCNGTRATECESACAAQGFTVSECLCEGDTLLSSGCNVTVPEPTLPPQTETVTSTLPDGTVVVVFPNGTATVTPSGGATDTNVTVSGGMEMNEVIVTSSDGTTISVDVSDGSGVLTTPKPTVPPQTDKTACINYCKAICKGAPITCKCDPTWKATCQEVSTTITSPPDVVDSNAACARSSRSAFVLVISTLVSWFIFFG